MTTDTLPKGFVWRHPTMDDLHAVVALINACDVAEYGHGDTEIEMVRSCWLSPNFDLAKDAWILLAPNGQVVGYESAEYGQGSEHVYGDGYVHPQYVSQGIGTHLLRLLETRACEQTLRTSAPMSIHATVSDANVEAHKLFEAEGYMLIRHFLRMEINLKELPPGPVWPAPIKLRQFVLGQDNHIAYSTMEEAFEDHWGHEPIPYEEWEIGRIKREDFDSTLWFLAFDGDEAAGAIFCNKRLDGSGWVRGVGVRRPWRRLGLGMAMLYHAFGEFYRRGIYNVGLGVDAQSLTGATRLYERIGMHTTRRYDTYQKPLPRFS